MKADKTADGQTDMTKLVVAFLSSVKAHETGGNPGTSVTVQMPLSPATFFKHNSEISRGMTQCKLAEGPFFTGHFPSVLKLRCVENQQRGHKEGDSGLET